MFKSSFIPLSFSWILMLITVSGTDKSLYPETKSLYNESDKILIAAHRGFHSSYPENSIPAIKECIIKGIDIVEIDIRETKDKVPVIIHDPDLSRTNNSPEKISELNFNELNKFPLLFEGKRTEHFIPSLEEVLQTTGDKIVLNLDFKLKDLNAFKRTYSLISKYKMENSVIVTVNDLKFIPELHKLNPEIRIMPVAFSWWKINKAISNDFLDVIQLYHRPYANYRIHKIEKEGIDIWVNALRKYDHLENAGKDGFKKLINIKKVDIIQTDYPEELLSFLRENCLHD